MWSDVLESLLTCNFWTFCTASLSASTGETLFGFCIFRRVSLNATALFEASYPNPLNLKPSLPAEKALPIPFKPGSKSKNDKSSEFPKKILEAALNIALLLGIDCNACA